MVSESRPDVVRALLVLLGIETLIGFFLVLYAGVFTIGAQVADDGWSDLVRVVGLMIGIPAAVVTIVLAAAWLKVRRRQAAAVRLTVVAQALVIALGVATVIVGSGRLVGVLIAAVLIGALGIYLAMTPAVRAWLGSPGSSS